MCFSPPAGTPQPNDFHETFEINLLISTSYFQPFWWRLWTSYFQPHWWSLWVAINFTTWWMTFLHFYCLGPLVFYSNLYFSNCGAHDPDCDRNLDKESLRISRPKRNYWSITGNDVHHCSNLCKDMICVEGHCYGSCNANEYLWMEKNLRILNIFVALNCLFVGILFLGFGSLLFMKWKPTNQKVREIQHVEEDEEDEMEPQKKTTFAKLLLFDYLKRKSRRWLLYIEWRSTENFHKVSWIFNCKLWERNKVSPLTAEWSIFLGFLGMHRQAPLQQFLHVNNEPKDSRIEFRWKCLHLKKLGFIVRIDELNFIDSPRLWYTTITIHLYCDIPL